MNKLADLRTQTSLFCGALALAIAVSILLRGRPRRAQILFAAFAADIGLWYLAQWLYHFVRADVWVRFTILLVVLLPQFALHLFDAVVPRKPGPSKLLRVAGILMLPLLVLVALPRQTALERDVIFLYVFGLLAAGLWSLAQRGEHSGSRAIQRRVRVLVSIGALAAAFSLADFLWFIGAPLPPVGAVLSVVFLFMLSESLIRQRLLDLFDVLVQLLVSTALAFGMAGVFYVFVVLYGGFETMYLGATLAAIVILVLVEPLRTKLEKYVHLVFFRERVALERALDLAKSQLSHVLEVQKMQAVVMAALEESSRVTGAAIYFRDPLGPDFYLGSFLGPAAPERIDAAAARPLLERLGKSASVVLQQLEFEALERRRAGWTGEGEADERILAAAKILGPYSSGVCLSIHGEDSQLLGFLLVADDRVRDALSDDEVALLESFALQIGVVVENSRQYRRMHQRDRLAALGQMAAGLAHEVKNPLGAIKGAAQLLNETLTASHVVSADKEFVDIILQEVDRLDRVVGSVLSYARPRKSDFQPLDVNEVVENALRIAMSDPAHSCKLEVQLGENLPLVPGDAEQLRQVMLNLVKNATQAVDQTGAVVVSTRVIEDTTQDRAGKWLEIAVSDTGKGMTKEIRQSLFVPFFTTKPKGTGLGLAISQRIVEEMGGRIDVKSQPGQGSTFSITLPISSVIETSSNPRAALRPGLGAATGSAIS
ncbi:MAG: ATP-binding protein [Polyangiaceae bacterium]|nr:ATP-binding protein [Polyangiaceae bacterium]